MIHVGDKIIVYPSDEYFKKCKDHVNKKAGMGDYAPYGKVINDLSITPLAVITADVDADFVEIEGYWKIYHKGIKAVITKEEYPEYFL